MAELTVEDVKVNDVIKYEGTAFLVDGFNNILEPDGAWVGINGTSQDGENSLYTFRPSEIQVRCHHDGHCRTWTRVGTTLCTEHTPPEDEPDPQS